MTVQEIFDIIDRRAPFALQESWDRSGLLVGDLKREVQRVLLTLDITTTVVKEAAVIGADLILSHHPVIWDPIRSISSQHPVWYLVQKNIAAICAHTNLDIAEGGLNDVFGDILAEHGIVQKPFSPLEQLSPGRALGRAADCTQVFTADSLAAALKSTTGCADIRYYAGDQKDAIRRVAWCTGSGGDLMLQAMAVGADALITADCKHSVWAEAHNLGCTLYDCGHFDTEVPAVKWFQRALAEDAPALHTVISTSGTMPFFKVLT